MLRIVDPPQVRSSTGGHTSLPTPLHHDDAADTAGGDPTVDPPRTTGPTPGPHDSTPLVHGGGDDAGGWPCGISLAAEFYIWRLHGWCPGMQRTCTRKLHQCWWGCHHALTISSLSHSNQHVASFQHFVSFCTCSRPFLDPGLFNIHLVYSPYLCPASACSSLRAICSDSQTGALARTM